MNMEIPVWTKPAIWGGIIGAIAITVVGFSADMIVTSSTATEMADSQSKEAMITALTPICVAQFKTLTPTNQTMQLAALKQESSYKRDDFVIAQGWATMPGNAEPSNEIGNACAAQLMKLTES
ncbi:hypothetical protein [Thalassospira alkalitolerans]|uniref:hypothetical protein n=1 Tax=Thalassospira alkalitolerans TaxID=1293890 RepID=UPI0030EB21F3|tara:strand:- start:189011 stop:189379 length:369 start_codon:yes stop_codon:yes gene_type:complete